MIDVKFYLMDPTVKRESIEGFKYLWLKQVYSFNDQHHCAKCLNGRYINNFSPRMGLDEPTTIHLEDDAVLYFCGVSQPFDWSRNLHLAVQPHEGSIIEHQLYNGLKLAVLNAREITFDDEAARTMYPDRGERYLSCRNFQFGAQHYRSQ